jgi:chorismate mutase
VAQSESGAALSLRKSFHAPAIRFKTPQTDFRPFMLDRPASETLADLRAEIDRIDAGLHALLMERGEIIDRLIAVKAGAGSAFRPDREAKMMRQLVTRHQGILPLDTVESIWRIIISTFTYVQASYSVHCDISSGDAPMRDGCRFHFGFTVPFVAHQSAAAVIEAVAASIGDLGLIAVAGSAANGAWWKHLLAASAPKIIARLPFVERPNHPAGLPLFVIAKPLSDAAARDIVLYALTIKQWHDSLPSALATLGTEICSTTQDDSALSLLLAAPGSLTHAELYDMTRKAGVDATNLTEIGSHAARFDLAKT